MEEGDNMIVKYRLPCGHINYITMSKDEEPPRKWIFFQDPVFKEGIGEYIGFCKEVKTDE